MPIRRHKYDVLLAFRLSMHAHVEQSCQHERLRFVEFLFKTRPGVSDGVAQWVERRAPHSMTQSSNPVRSTRKT